MRDPKETDFHLYEFAEFRLLPSERLLLRGTHPVPLPPKVFDTLAVLVERSGHLVEKDELLETVWSDTFVEEATLARNISILRKAFGESAHGQKFIETVPKRGYRFVEPVRRQIVGENSATIPDPEENASPQPKTRRPVLWLVLAFIIVVFFASLSFWRAKPQNSSSIESIAVLPLENLSGDPSQEYFADGMTEALINNLARIRALKVISRNSVMRYKRSNKPLPEIARELNVDAVITGSVQRAGERVRVTAQLIHAQNDVHLWASDYESDLTDVLKLENQVAHAVAKEIGIQVTAEEKERLASSLSVNPEAHEAYLLGRFHFGKDDDQGLKHALEYFGRAIALAPDYAPPYGGLSDAWLARGLTGTVNFKETETPARAAALKAIELDEQLAEAHLALASIKQHYDWDWTGAEQECMRAIELDPGSLDVHTAYGYLLMHLGRLDEAIREGEIVVKLDPVSSAAHSALGRFLYRAHKYEEALPELLRAAELEPQSLTPNYRLGDLYAQLGRYDEALAAYEKSGKAITKGGYPHAGIARVYALMGRTREARQMVSGLKDNPYIIAAVYAALDDKDEAFRILGKAVDEHQLMTPIKVEPPLESLHSDPRWKALLHRMNFPSE